jgi:hypothetical protein
MADLVSDHFVGYACRLGIVWANVYSELRPAGIER